MEELLASRPLKTFKKGDTVTGIVVSIAGKEVLIDVGGKTEGIIGEKEWAQVKDYVSQLSPGDPITGVVISSENDRGQVVLSLRKAGSSYRWKRVSDLLSSGDSITVRGLEVNKGGLLVDFESLRGFLPGSQLSTAHQGDLSKLMNKLLTVKVIEVDQAQNRLIFSEKAAVGAEDLAKKLDDVRSKVKIGEKYSGKVSAIMPYGIFVNLETGADGLVHISEVSWQKVDDLSKLYKVGDTVEVLVLGISETDGKLNLTIKQLLPDPWLKVADKYTKDQTVTGEVSKVTQYGVFVELEDSVEGLMRISKIPPSMQFAEGDKITATIESVDLPSHKISLLPVLTEKPVGYK